MKWIVAGVVLFVVLGGQNGAMASSHAARIKKISEMNKSPQSNFSKKVFQQIEVVGKKARIKSSGTSRFDNYQVGSSGTIDFVYSISSLGGTATAVISSVNISSSPDVSLSNDGCSGRTISDGGSCTITLMYQPTQKRSASVTSTITAMVTLITPEGEVIGPESRILTADSSGSSLDPVGRCNTSAKGSIINVDDRSVGESVPVAGTNFALVYSSIFSGASNDRYEAIPSGIQYNIDRWNPSIYHYYSSAQERLFSGTGEIQPIRSSDRDGVFKTVSPDGSQVFEFINGYHVRTRSSLTGVVLQTFIRDNQNRLSKVIDAYGKETIFNRNSVGDILSIVAPKGQVTTLTTDSQGRVATIANPKGEAFTMTYQGGLLSTFTKPGGQVTTFTYDNDGKLLRDLGNGGDFWDFVESSSGLIQKTSNLNRKNYLLRSTADGWYVRDEQLQTGFTQTRYEGRNGESASVSVLQESERSIANDPRFGNTLAVPASEKVTIGGVTKETTYSYTSDATTDPFSFTYLNQSATINGKTHTNNFNKATMTWTSISAAGATAQTVLDSFERPSSVKMGADAATTFTYNSEGQLSSSGQGSGYGEKYYTYNPQGLLQTIKLGTGETTSYTYDSAGRVTSVAAPDLNVTQYSYDPNGNIKTIRLAGRPIIPKFNAKDLQPVDRPIHNFEYNAFELTSKYQAPQIAGAANTSTVYAYDMDKQLTQITRPSGSSVVFHYGAVSGRLGGLTFSGGDTVYTYYANTNLLQQADSKDGLRSNFQYLGDKVALIESRWAQNNFLLGKISYNFDNEHRISGRILQGNLASSAVLTPIVYNNDDVPTQIGGLQLSYEYPSGRLSSSSLDTITDQRTYDAFGNLSGYTSSYTPVGGTPTLLYSYTLSRDKNHRIIGKSETVLGVFNTYTYTYDIAGRLTGAIKGKSAENFYSYDSNGNRVSGSIAGVGFKATFDNQDRILTQGVNKYGYDPDGNLSRITYPDNSVQLHVFDEFGNIKFAQRKNGTLELYAVDGANQIVSMYTGSPTTLDFRYIYESPYRIAGRLNDSGVLLERYTYGTRVNTPEYMIKNSQRYRIIADHLGSPRLVVNTADGTIAQRMDYDEFGVVTADSNPGFQAYGFAGGIYFKSLKLVKFGARLYDAETGRWVSKDPILFGGGDTNLYGYTFQDPINFVDPSGLRTPGQGVMCPDGNCGGNMRDQHMSGAQMSAQQIAQQDAFVRGIVTLAVGGPGAVGMGVRGANACLSNPALCVELVTTGAGAVGSGLTGDNLPPGSASNTWIAGIDLFGGSAVELIKENVCK